MFLSTEFLSVNHLDVGQLVFRKVNQLGDVSTDLGPVNLITEVREVFLIGNQVAPQKQLKLRCFLSSVRELSAAPLSEITKVR